MDGDLKEAMASGVFLEFCDAWGHTVGQAVFSDWHGKPVPAEGDLVSCPAVSAQSGRRKMVGRVLSRHFQVQLDNDGQSAVWVRLVLAAVTPGGVSALAHPSRRRFAPN